MLSLILKNYLKNINFFNIFLFPYLKVECFQNNNFTLFIIKGDYGLCSILLNFGLKDVTIKIENNIIFFNNIQSKNLKIFRNSLFKLFVNLMVGLSKGWTSFLKIKGFGFRNQIKKNKLILKIGFSHLNYFFIPSEIKIKRIKKNILKIFCLDLQKLNEVTFLIKNFRAPNAYRDKGISLRNEILKFKPGKKGKF